MRSAVIIVTLLFSTPSQAWSFCDGYLTPPVDHQKTPTVAYDVVRLQPKHVIFLCGVDWVPAQLFGGCAMPSEDEGPWTVYIRDDLTPEETGCVLFHEMSHLPPNNNAHSKGWGTPEPRLSARMRRYVIDHGYAPRMPSMVGK